MSKRLTVAARLTGGLGDVLMASPFLEELYQILQGADITVYYHTPDAAAFVFAQARFVQAVSSHTELLKPKSVRADLLVHTGHFPRYIVQNDRAVRFASPEFLDVMRIANERAATVAGLISQHPKLDGFWARMQTAQGRSYLDGMGWLSALDVSSNSHPFLSLDPAARQVLSTLPSAYLTIHDGFDVRQLPKAGAATKCWGINQWATLVKELRKTVPGFAVIQLGAGKSRVIPGVDVSLVNQTSLAETAWVLKSAALHIDTDSGLAHMARCLHTPAVVMFGPTNPAYFGHQGNCNLSPSLCGDCWWSTPDWLARCPRGLVEPECMGSISVNAVMSAVVNQVWRQREAAAASRLTASALQLYDGHGPALVANICDTLKLPRKPITEHIVDGTTGVYIHASKQWEYGYALGAIHDYLPNVRARVADIGGGRGALAPYLASLGDDVTQFDLDYEWGKGAASEAEYRAYAKTRGYQARYGSIYNLPAGSAEYDVVLCISVLEHLPEKTAALRELLRILKPGGVLILTFDFASQPELFRDKFRVDVFGPDSLEREMHLLGCTDFHSTSDLTTGVSAELIAADSVLGIPEGMTVAGLVIRKAVNSVQVESVPAGTDGDGVAWLETVPQ